MKEKKEKRETNEVGKGFWRKKACSETEKNLIQKEWNVISFRLMLHLPPVQTGKSFTQYTRSNISE